MKKIFFLLLMCFTMSTFAKATNDTIPFNQQIDKVIEDESVSNKGNITKKYYFLIDGCLVSTSKATVEKYNLAKKYNAKVTLWAIVDSKKNLKKIIAL